MGAPREIPDTILEKEFRKSTPPVLYKYRNWGDKNHIETLTKQQIWFSNPKQLNDLYDIRLAYSFNSEEVFSPLFYAKLKKEFPQMTRFLPGTKKFEYALENHYELIKADPQKWFNENLANLRKSNLYDVIGLFSTTTDPLEELMWAHYGDSHRGYCLGYDSFQLWQAKKSMFGSAHYIGQPVRYSFIDNNPEDLMDVFIKSARWSYEKEYRLITFVESDEERLAKVKPSALKEVILGSQISLKSEGEIIDCLKNIYESRVLLYKIESDNVPKLQLKQVLY